MNLSLNPSTLTNLGCTCIKFGKADGYGRRYGCAGRSRAVRDCDRSCDAGAAVRDSPNSGTAIL